MKRVGASLIAVVVGCGIFLVIPEGFADTSTISTDEFLRSPAAELFQAGDYERALKAMAPLLEEYPDDPLLIRYNAMILDRMGRSEQAITLFQELLKKDPDHAPTRYFLGQAYQRKGDQELAVQEWRWAAEHGQGTPYQAWAEESLKEAGIPVTPSKPRRQPRWNISARYGYEYDSNVILKPKDKSLANATDPKAGRHTGDLILRYRAFSQRDLAVDLLYAARQSLHDNSLNEFNFTSQETGIQVKKRTQILNRDVIFGTRYDLLAGFLDGDTFSLRNQWTLEADSRLTAHTRTVFSYRFTVSNFGPDGSNPPQTSRDGVSNDAGVTQYFYSRDFLRHVFIQEEFNSANTRGGNFELRGSTTSVGLHTPLFWKMNLDLIGAFLFAKYPRFTSLSSLDTDKRRDRDWDLYVALTRPLTSKIKIRAFYRLIKAGNRNGFFEYERHIGGVQALFSEAF